MLVKIFRSTLFFVLFAHNLPLSVTAFPPKRAVAQETRYEIPFDYADAHDCGAWRDRGPQESAIRCGFWHHAYVIDREYAPAQAAGEKLEVTHFASSVSSTEVGINQLELGEMVIPQLPARFWWI